MHYCYVNTPPNTRVETRRCLLACLSALLAGPEVSHGELEVRSVVGLPHAAVAAAGGLVLALVVDAAHSQVHVLRGEVVSGDVQVAGLVVLGDRLGGLQSDVAVEVGQRSGQRASGPVVGRLREGKVTLALRDTRA